MIKLFTAALIFFALSTAGIAQQNADSLWNVWADESHADSIRVKALTDFYAKEYMYRDIDSALIFVRMHYNFAKKHELPKHIATGLNSIGQCKISHGELDSALFYFGQAIPYFQQVGDKKGEAGAVINSGIVLANSGLPHAAIRKYREGIALCEAAGEVKFKLNALNNLAVTYLNRGILDSAAPVFRQVIREAEKEMPGSDAHKGGYVNLGYVLAKQGNHAEAIDHFHTCLRLIDQYGGGQVDLYAYNFLGSSYLELGESENALIYFQKSYDRAKKFGDRLGMSGPLSNMAQIYKDEGDFVKARELYTEALNVLLDSEYNKAALQQWGNLAMMDLEEGKLDSAEARFSRNLEEARKYSENDQQAFALIGLGKVNNVRKRFSRAITFLREAREIGLELGQPNLVMGANEALYEAYKNTGQSARALESYEAYIANRDSIERNDNKRAAIQQEFRYAYEKQAIADSIAALEKDLRVEHTHKAELRKKNQTRNVLLTGGLIIFLMAGGLWSRVRFVRKANARLEKEKARAEESEQFKQQFLANMSHEIRTPMNAILGMTNLTLNTKLQPKQKQYLEAIRKSSENLIVIINDILDLSKLEAGKMELESIPFSLHDQVGLVYDTLRFKAEEKGLIFKATIRKDVPQVLIGDPSRLMQVLINLSGNAIKFTDKGSVEVVVELIPETEATVLFRVIDTGIGIQDDKFEVLFNAFQQADASIARKYGGTGLGLTISRTIIEMQNGKLDLQSKPNEGTEFFFTIPYKPASEAQVAQVISEKQIDAAALCGIKILVAEDNEYNRIVVNDTLENLIPEVHIQHAENGEIALGLVQQNDFDVVLMDANMPGMDGLEATRHIRSLEGPKKHIPIIALTASVLAADIAKCIDCGMNDSVPKPFTREQLLAALMQFYRYTGPEPAATETKTKSENAREETPAEPNDSLINLKFLREFCGGNETRMRKYIDLYLNSVPKDIQRIETALEAGDYKTLKTVMHSMKPHFNFMGMEQTRTKADQVEGLITNGHTDSDQVKSLVQAIVEDCEASVKEWG